MYNNTHTRIITHTLHMYNNTQTHTLHSDTLAQYSEQSTTNFRLSQGNELPIHSCHPHHPRQKLCNHVIVLNIKTGTGQLFGRNIRTQYCGQVAQGPTGPVLGRRTVGQPDKMEYGSERPGASTKIKRSHKKSTCTHIQTHVYMCTHTNTRLHVHTYKHTFYR